MSDLDGLTPLAAWREGRLLIVAVHAAVLPPRCVRCNRATNRFTAVKVTAATFGATYARVGVCRRHRLTSGRCALFAVLAAVVVAAALSALDLDAGLGSLPITFLLVLFLLLFAFSTGLGLSARSDPYFAILTGAGSAYLDELPPPGTGYHGPRQGRLLR